MIELTDNGDPETQSKYIQYLASQSKLHVNDETGEAWYDGNLVEGLKLMELNTEDLRTQCGLDIETEIRHTFLNELTKRCGLTKMQKDMAQAKLIVVVKVRRI